MHLKLDILHLSFNTAIQVTMQKKFKNKIKFQCKEHFANTINPLIKKIMDFVYWSKFLVHFTMLELNDLEKYTQMIKCTSLSVRSQISSLMNWMTYIQILEKCFDSYSTSESLSYSLKMHFGIQYMSWFISLHEINTLQNNDKFYRKLLSRPSCEISLTYFMLS